MNLPFRGKENAQIQSMALPSLDMLPRPEILFASHTPYQILIKTIHSGIVVYGSHQPSLELLASYLGKNTKTMKNDTRKVSAIVTPGGAENTPCLLFAQV